MKRIKTIAAVLAMALLCFAGTAMAGESSFYDTTNGWIVRAYTEQNPTGGMYSIKVEILDEQGNYFTPLSDILLNDSVLAENPFLIDANQVDSEVSIAHKDVSGGTEIFVFGNEDGIPGQIHNNRTLSRNVPIAPANISVPSSSAFGNVNVGSSLTNYITVSNTGQANLTLSAINVTGTSFSRNGGTCGTAIAGGNSCTIGVEFEPAAATSYSGTLTIQSNDGDQPTANVSLTGTGYQQTGTVDLVVSKVSAGTNITNGGTLAMTVYVKNNGTGTSGPFVVRGTKGTTTQMYTWNIPSLAPGQEIYARQTYTITCATHQTFYLYHTADSSQEVAESNETNNQKITSVSCSR